MDNRTKREKLRAMANQSVSPEEAEVAKRKLDAMGPEPEPEPTIRIISFTIFNGWYAATGSSGTIVFTATSPKS